MTNRLENSDRLYFFGSKITADGECSHEIKRSLILGRKAMTDLNRVLKIRDNSFPRKVCIVKAMVFPIIVLSAEEFMLSNCGAGEDA